MGVEEQMIPMMARIWSEVEMLRYQGCVLSVVR
jgi:hypothetical protein